MPEQHIRKSRAYKAGVKAGALAERNAWLSKLSRESTSLQLDTNPDVFIAAALADLRKWGRRKK